MRDTRRFASGFVAACVLVAASCVEPCPFEGHTDDTTSAIFMGDEPTCEQLDMWRRVWSSAADVWGADPEPMYLWFIELEDQLVYMNGNIVECPIGGGGVCVWTSGRLPDIYIATWNDPMLIERVLCHELTHVYWRILDHDLNLFQTLEMELLEEVRSRNPDYVDYNIWSFPEDW